MQFNSKTGLLLLTKYERDTLERAAKIYTDAGRILGNGAVTNAGLYGKAANVVLGVEVETKEAPDYGTLPNGQKATEPAM